ncbi:uncharacterized protein N7479_004957 [Penicillium vulpinum]|uniref:Clr5 domain-containing protein n=1 Tax=Penicillium vulpinum TaxID=29845 RepID=A0A1V6RH76_9EURO|nr:uncharacterized protein N7479_004957 [Penicillium vulpinum]KAJ5965081.1 hypothetical protein N7479_004957 [Penicillium vulpinum]OQE00743.1 hypothetical protein PENVUL_c047G05677 [Penicillium vulpinum]
MPPTAPRIPDEIWAQHREELITFYFESDNTLQETISYMKERYGFEATKNQYTAKLKSWGVTKYFPGSIWGSVASVKRKREQEGKDSDFAFHDRKLTRQKVDKEIARHVSSIKLGPRSENAVLPDYITVSTPLAESSGISREALLCGIPWYQYTQDIHTLVSERLKWSIAHSIPNTSIEIAIKELSSESPNHMLRFWGNDSPNDCELPTYLPPEEIKRRGSSTGKLGTLRKDSPASVLTGFLQRIFFLSTNNLIHQFQFNKVCDQIVSNFGADILVFLCRPKSPSMKVFAGMVLSSAFESGNTLLIKRLIHHEANLPDHISHSPRWAGYLSMAFHHRDEGMVKLLCEAGVPPKLKFGTLWVLHDNSYWDSHLSMLHVLLALGADPERFVIGKQPGFPLIDAARTGSLGAVKLLLSAGARVDIYIPQECGTALQAAAWGGHFEVAKYLIQSGAAINGPDPQLLQQYQWFDLGIMDITIALQTPVQLAAKRNDMALLQFLLEQGASTIACEISMHPSLMKYCIYRSGHFNWEGKYKLNGVHDHPSRYNAHNSVYTALQYGVLNQNLSVVALLLTIGADSDSRVGLHMGDTPLQMSAVLGNVEIFRLLLRGGADVNAPPAVSSGRSAVQAAAESGNWEILLMLQKAGANMNAPAGAIEGLDALQVACLNGHSLMAGFFLAHQANVNAAPSTVTGLTSIQAAASFGDIRLVRDLISLGAEVNAPATKNGTTALLAAMHHRSLPLLELLVQSGATVNPGDPKLPTPLRLAASLDWLEGVKFLLDHEATVNEPIFDPALSNELYDMETVDPSEASPLGQAIKKDAENMVDLLLRHGADVLAMVYAENSDIQFEGALICSIRSRSSLKIVNLIFAKVSDFEKHPGWEDTLKVALEYDIVDMNTFKVLIEKASSLAPPFRCNVIRKGWNSFPANQGYNEEEEDNPEQLLEIIQLLVDSGADVNCRKDNGSTMLQRLAGRCYPKACRFLVNCGAAVNTHAVHYHGTPLQEAIKYSNTKIADFLLEHGADVNALPAEYWGVTALQAASINGMFELAVRLLERGADVSAPAAPNEGRTAIDGAAERGHLEMVQLLLNAYGKQDDLRLVCNQAADYAEKEDHFEIAQWLRGYSPA